MDIETVILPIIALFLSGLLWNMGGYLAAWRKNKDDPEWTGFDKKKLRDDLILGTVLGVGAVVAGIANDSLSVVGSASAFLWAVWGGFPLVAAVDKFIVGGLFKK